MVQLYRWQLYYGPHHGTEKGVIEYLLFIYNIYIIYIIVKFITYSFNQKSTRIPQSYPLAKITAICHLYQMQKMKTGGRLLHSSIFREIAKDTKVQFLSLKVLFFVLTIWKFQKFFVTLQYQY